MTCIDLIVISVNLVIDARSAVISAEAAEVQKICLAHLLCAFEYRIMNVRCRRIIRAEQLPNHKYREFLFCGSNSACVSSRAD